jgi:hypothetical protein
VATLATLQQPPAQMFSVLAGGYATRKEYVFSHPIYYSCDLFIISISRQLLAVKLKYVSPTT